MVGALISIGVAFFIALSATIACYMIVNSMALKGDLRMRKAGAFLDLANVRKTPEFVATTICGIGSLVWFLASLAMHFGLIVQIVTFPIFVGATFGLAYVLINRRVTKQRTLFMDQLEMALRLISGGVRIGLSLPQAMMHITEEMSDPARTEFHRVIAQTRVGATTADALDNLAERMSGSETIMLARVIRVQTQTGGSLSVILDHLAETIKERRYIQRKIAALTAEGRIGALVLEALPIGVGLFVIIAERPMGEALIGTWLGHAVLAWAAFLEGMAIYTLNKMLKVNV